MHDFVQNRNFRMVLLAGAVCVGLYASYVAYLVVPYVVMTVVPSVVREVVTH